NKGFLTNKLDIVQRRKDLAMERIRTKNSVVVLEDGRTIRVPEFGAWAAQMKKLNKHLTDDQIMQEYRNRYDR
ncbi:MAG: hypothetical protein KAR06_07940, partial [Deltaproteobacteria bacterium]|nr:hypothetical protein [Deltaproteobacteria bacterium]